MKRNLGPKLGSLALAVLLWFHIATERDGYERVLEVPILVTGLPAGRVLAREIPPAARVRFRGKGKQLFALPWREVKVVVDASEAGVRGIRPLGREQVVYPERADLAVVEVIEPVSVTVVLDQRVTRLLPVSPRVALEIAPGHTRVGTWQVLPDSVHVSGPEEFLRNLTEVLTDSLRLTRVRAAVDREVNLLGPARYNVTLSPASVMIRVNVQPIGERLFGEIPVEVRGPAADRYLAQPRTAAVTVSGGLGVLEGLTAADIHVIVELGEDPPDGLVPREALVEIPPEVTLLRIDPPRFRITEF